MARTVNEIRERIEEVAKRDLFGTERNRLIYALPFDDARDYLVQGASQERFEEGAQSPEDGIRGYLPFAIGKAEDHRGLSAGRSVSHMQGMVWLMGDEAYSKIDWDQYPQYGVPILKQCAELVGFPWPEKASLKRMAAGRPCEEGCQEGCDQ